MGTRSNYNGGFSFGYTGGSGDNVMIEEQGTINGHDDVDRKDKNVIVPISFTLHGLMTGLHPSSDGQQGPSTEYGLTEFKPMHFGDKLHMRNFIISSAETFTKARTEYHKSHPEPLNTEKLSSLSRSYRAIILDLVQSLENSHDDSSAMLFTHLDFVWHFCEIMFISSHPELPVLPYLMSWVQQNFDTSEEILNELGPQLPNLAEGSSSQLPIVLAQDLMTENLEKIWRIIYLYTFHGRTIDAMKLLPYTNIRNSKSYDEQIHLMQELMRKKPAFTPMTNSVSEFESQWFLWREECENRLNQKAFHGSQQLIFLAKVLSGNQDGFAEAKDYISTWYEYLIMMLNYQYPTIRPTLLKGFAKKAIDDYGDFGIQLKPIEEVILAAMDYDIVAVLKEMQNHFQHPWFALHFSDLLFHGGEPGTTLDEISIDYKSIGLIRDDLLQEYGASLMQHSSLWEVGIKYLAAVSNRQGWPVILQLLRRRKPSTEFEAEKLIRIGEQFGFSDEVQGICKEVALQALNNDRIQQALLWSVRSSDVPLTSKIVDLILTDDNEILNIAPILIAYLPKLYNCGERILFLKGFSEFRHYMNENNYEAAIVALCHLIHDQLIPKRMANKVLNYLHVFSEIGFKFRPEEISTLTEYIQTKIDRDLLEPEEFRKLNKLLLMNRAHSLLMAFRAANKEKESILPGPGK